MPCARIRRIATTGDIQQPAGSNMLVTALCIRKSARRTRGSSGGGSRETRPLTIFGFRLSVAPSCPCSRPCWQRLSSSLAVDRSARWSLPIRSHAGLATADRRRVGATPSVCAPRSTCRLRHRAVEAASEGRAWSGRTRSGTDLPGPPRLASPPYVGRGSRLLAAQPAGSSPDGPHALPQTRRTGDDRHH